MLRPLLLALLLVSAAASASERASAPSSIVVPAASTIQGIAGTTTAITYTISGTEIQGAVETVRIAQGQLPTSTGTLYTAPAGTQLLVNSIMLINATGSPVSGVKLFVGGSAASNQILSSLTIPANGQATYSEGGWRVQDANGALQTASSGGTTYTASSGLKSVGNDFRIDNPLAAIYGGLGADLSGASSGRYPKSNGAGVFASSTLAASGIGGCTNQFARALNADAAPTCESVSLSADVTGALAQASVTNLVSDLAAKQPLDGTLTALAGADWAANALPIGTGADALSQTSFAANTFPARASTGSLVAKVITDFGLSMVDDTDNTAARSTLGLGTAATQNTGTSGATIPFLNGTNTWGAVNTFSSAPVMSGASITGATIPAASLVSTISAGGPTGSSSVVPVVTYNASGQLTTVTTATITPAAIGAPAGSGTSSGTNTGDVSLTTSGATANANGASLVGQQLQLQAASTAFAGLMSAADKLKLDGVWRDATSECNVKVANSAATNQTNLAACITGMPAAGGVMRFSEVGTIQHTGTFTVDKPIIFKGVGRAVTNICSTSATADQFDLVTGSQGAGFEQIRLTGCAEATRTGGFAIDMNGISNVYVQQSDILFHHSGIRSAGALQFIDDVNIREGGENAANGAAILVDAFGDRYIRRLTTDGGPGDPTGYAGIRVRQCSSLVITDSNIINSGNALDLVPNGGGGTAVASVLVTGTFFDNSSIGVNMLPATSSDTIHRVRFVNSWFGSNSVANVRMGNGTIPNANIAAVEFIGNDFFGGSVSPLGLDVLGATDWSVKGNRFGGHTTRAIQVAVGVGSADHRFSITDSHIGNILGGGTNAQGITIGAGTYGQYTILDNSGFSQNTTVGMVDNGSVGATGFKNIANNMGCFAGPMQPLASGGGSVLANAGRGAVTSGAAETFLMTFRVPGNCVAIGDVIHITATLQSSSTGTLTPRVRAGTAGTTADALINVSGVSAAGTANSFLTLNAYIYVVALGPTATVAAAIQGTSTAAAFNNAVAAEALGNVVTTGTWFITFAGTASAGTYTVRQVRARII